VRASRNAKQKKKTKKTDKNEGGYLGSAPEPDSEKTAGIEECIKMNVGPKSQEHTDRMKENAT